MLLTSHAISSLPFLNIRQNTTSPSPLPLTASCTPLLTLSTAVPQIPLSPLSNTSSTTHANHLTIATAFAISLSSFTTFSKYPTNASTSSPYGPSSLNSSTHALTASLNSGNVLNFFAVNVGLGGWAGRVSVRWPGGAWLWAGGGRLRLEEVKSMPPFFCRRSRRA